MSFYADEELEQENIGSEHKTSSFISDDELLSNGIDLNNNSSFKTIQNNTPLQKPITTQQPAAQNIIQPQNQVQPQQNQVVNNVQPATQQGFNYNRWVSDRPTNNIFANAGKDAAEIVGGLSQLLGQGAVGSWNAITHPIETGKTIGNYFGSLGNDVSDTQNVANALITNALNGNFNNIPNNLDTYRKDIRQNHPVLSTLKDAFIQGIKEQYGQGDRSILKDGIDWGKFGQSFLQHPLMNGLDVVGAGEIGKIDKISDAIKAAEKMNNIKAGAAQKANTQAKIDAKVAELKANGKKVPNNIAEQFQDVIHYDDKGNKYRLDINGNPQYFDKPTENLVLKPIDYALQSEPVQRLVQATDGPVQNLLGTFTGMKESNPLLGKQASARARLRQLEKDRKNKTNQQLIDAERENNQNFGNLTDEQGKDIIKNIEGKTETTNPNIEIPNAKITENSKNVLKGEIIKNETPDIPNSKNVTSDANSLKGEVVRDNVAQIGNTINKTNADGIVEINGKFYWDNAKGEIPDNIAPEKLNGVIVDGKSYVEIGEVPKDLKTIEQPFEVVIDNDKANNTQKVTKEPQNNVNSPEIKEIKAIRNGKEAGYGNYFDYDDNAVYIDYIRNTTKNTNNIEKGVGTELVDKIIAENPNKNIIWDSVDKDAETFKQAYLNKNPELKTRVFTEGDYKTLVAQAKDFGYNNVNEFFERLRDGNKRTAGKTERTGLAGNVGTDGTGAINGRSSEDLQQKTQHTDTTGRTSTNRQKPSTDVGKTQERNGVVNNEPSIRTKEDIQNEIAQINQELSDARHRGMSKQARKEFVHERNARLKELKSELKEQKNTKNLENNTQNNVNNIEFTPDKTRYNNDLDLGYNSDAFANPAKKQYFDELLSQGKIDKKVYDNEVFLDDVKWLNQNGIAGYKIKDFFKRHKEHLPRFIQERISKLENGIDVYDSQLRGFPAKNAFYKNDNSINIDYQNSKRSDYIRKLVHELTHAVDENVNELDDLSKNKGTYFDPYTKEVVELPKIKWGNKINATAAKRTQQYDEFIQKLIDIKNDEKLKKDFLKKFNSDEDLEIAGLKIPKSERSSDFVKFLKDVSTYLWNCYNAHPAEVRARTVAEEAFDNYINVKYNENKVFHKEYIYEKNRRKNNRQSNRRSNKNSTTISGTNGYNNYRDVRRGNKGQVRRNEQNNSKNITQFIDKTKDSEVVNALFDTKNKFKNKLKQNSDYYKSIGKLTDDTENANIIDTFAAYKNGITKRDKITDSMREEALKVINSLPEDKRPFYVPRMYDEHLTKADFGLGHYRQLDDIDELKHRSYTGDADKIKNGKLTRSFNIEKIANRLDEHRIKLDNMSKYIDDITNSLAKPLDKIENLQKGYVAFNPEKIKSVFFGKTNFEDLVVDGLKEHRSIEASLKNALQKNADELKTDAEEVLQKLQNSTDNLYQIPEKVYEDLVNSVSYKSNKALNIWDIGTDAFKKNVLGLNAKWVINNRIGNTIMAAFKGTNLLNPMNVKRISKLSDDLFPAELTGETFHSAEKMGKLKSTGYKGLDNVLSLLDGNSVNDSKVLSALSLPGKVVNRISKTVFDTNQKFEVMDRKTAYLKGIDNKKKEILKTTGKKFMSDKELLTYAKNNPELKKEILKHVDDTLGDYSSMSHIERSIIKRIIPFYSWLRTITRHTLSLPKTNPIRTSIMSKISAFSHEERDDLPFYQKNAVDTDYRSEKDNRELMLNFEHSVPYSTFGESGENPMSLFDPAIKNAVDAAAGVNTYNGMPLVSKRYASNTGGGYINTKGGGEIENLPASEKTKAYLIKTLRDKLPGLKQTERVLGGIMFSKKHKPYDKLYDTDFGGYMEEDIRKNAKGWSEKEQLLRYVLPIQKKGKVTKNKNNYRYKKAHKRMLNKE